MLERRSDIDISIDINDRTEPTEMWKLRFVTDAGSYFRPKIR